jgi:hypothetical protein
MCCVCHVAAGLHATIMSVGGGYTYGMATTSWSASKWSLNSCAGQSSPLETRHPGLVERDGKGGEREIWGEGESEREEREREREREIQTERDVY